jgi:hypothetical protein
MLFETERPLKVLVYSPNGDKPLRHAMLQRAAELYPLAQVMPRTTIAISAKDLEKADAVIIEASETTLIELYQGKATVHIYTKVEPTYSVTEMVFTPLPELENNEPIAGSAYIPELDPLPMESLTSDMPETSGEIIEGVLAETEGDGTGEAVCLDSQGLDPIVQANVQMAAPKRKGKGKGNKA